MGTAIRLSDTLFGRTRGAVLAVLYGHVGESYYLRQLARMTESRWARCSESYANW